ncbi:tetratricopeptide repeat protein [Hymenobacter weizhouensis]|uniref:tetratricopeptide repeat protein n=1 Tax=Hymenobacter sp. YIM 151500-1 TaxID=2987689 RepID=UPI002225F72B|nr:tetratricopeptide repeat protein [Hymenobacter sp. YIM 151500-1]UYZ64470.1 tetratricopeptide repeat protein [Hymenobacter sp. YIM 151500-1]
MKSTLLAGVLLLSLWGGLTRIQSRNSAVQRGAEAYARQDFAAAAQAYREAAVDLQDPDESVWLNLAHATLRAGRPAEARTYYGRLVSSRNRPLRSVALQQLGLLAADKGDYAQAISQLRQALLANPANADARYNYEVLREFLARRAADPQVPPPGTDGGPSPTDPSQRQPQERAGTDRSGQLDDPSRSQRQEEAQAQASPNGQRNPNQPGAGTGDGPGGFRPGQGAQRNVAQGSTPGSVRGLSTQAEGPEAPSGTSRRGGTDLAAPNEANLQTQRARLQQMNLSPGQARQILESLNAAEQQYLQQLPRQGSRKSEAGKPGW